MAKFWSRLSLKKVRQSRRGSAGVRKMSVERLDPRQLLAVDGFVGLAPSPHVVWAPGTPDSVIESFEEQHSGGGLASPIGMAGGDFNAVDGNRWSRTATNGSGLGQGDATVLTWSVVPDGTPLTSGAGEANTPSNLQAFLNNLYGSSANWLPVLEQAFASWEEVSGIDFVYEANDDGAGYSFAAAGVTGVRGDIRLAGHAIDGSSGILAYNWYPNYGEMVLDTSDSFFSNLSNNSLRLRNTVAHEIGHGLGLGHSLPRSGTKLMEPSISLGFDGPQHDDVLRINRGYGDRHEPNDSPAAAVALGSISSTPLVVDTLSIDDDSDVDFFQFSVGASSQVNIALDPIGSVYTVGAEGSVAETVDTRAQSNLAISVLDASGVNVVAQANAAGLGASEILTGLNLGAGTYLARVTGAQNAAQLYRLTLSSSSTGAGDATPPTLVTRTPTAGAQITSSSVNIDVQFSEAVVGVDASDLQLTGAAAVAALVGQPQNLGNFTWRFPVSGLGTGSLNVTLAGDANDIEDLADNDLPPSVWSYTVALDSLQLPPELAAIGDRTATAGTANTIALSASDPNGDPLTFSATGNSLEYHLDQTLGLNGIGGSEYFNWSGLNEKWVIGSNNIWYYVKPNGQLYRWNGGAVANDTLVDTVSTSAYANTALLYNAAANNPPASLAVSGNSLIVTPQAGFTGKFFVTVSVSDGRGGSDSETIAVTVTSGGATDTTPPTVVSHTPAAGQTVTSGSVAIDVTFSEPVVGVQSGDLRLSGTGASGAVVAAPSLVSGNTWRFPVSGLSSGAVQVTLAPNAGDIRDAAGNNLAPKTWSFSVQLGSLPLPPVLAPIADQTTAAGQVLTVALNASDPNGDLLTFTISGQSEAYTLDQQLGLSGIGGSEYFNWGGKNEKWVLATGGTWYYLTPDGTLYRWLGGSLSSDPSVAVLGSSYYQDTSLLYNATPNNPPAALSISGTQAIIQPNAGFRGKFYVTVTVSDGTGGTASRTFAVTVS